MRQKTIEEFVRALASSKPTPGGGSVSALAASLAGALGCMVANITLAKDSSPQLEKLRDQAEQLYESALHDIQRDMDAYDAVITAMKLPKKTDEEKRQRTEKLQESLKQAARIPYEVGDKVLQVLRLTRDIAAHARSTYISDLGVANFMALAGLMSAVVNVEINLHAIHDKAFTADMEKKLAALEEEAHTLFAQIEEAVKERMLAQA